MDQTALLTLPEAQIAHYLRNYKRVYRLSYGDLADLIGCSRESLSNFMNGKGVGTHCRKQINEWCMKEKSITNTLFRDLLTDMCCPNLDPTDPHYASASTLADRIAINIKEQLKEISLIPDLDRRITALENLYRRISR